MKIDQIEPQFARKLDHPLKNILQELRYLVPDNYQPRVSLLDGSGRKKRSNASADNWTPESGRIEIRFEPARSERKGPTEVIRMKNIPYREIANLYNSGMTIAEISDKLKIYASPGSKNKYARMNNIITKLKAGVKVGNEIIRVEPRNRNVTRKLYGPEESGTKTLDRIEGIPADTSAGTRADRPLRAANADSAEGDLLNVFIRALHRAESKPGWNFVSLKKFRDEVLPYEPFDAGAFQPTDIHWQRIFRMAEERKLIVVGKVPNPKSPQFPVTSIRLNRLMPEVQEVLGIPKKDLGFHPIHIKGEPLSATILRERR